MSSRASRSSRCVQRHDVLAIQIDLTRQRLDQPQDRPARSGFATAGFAHKAQRLALVDGKRQVLDRVHIGHGAAEKPALDREPRGQVLDRQQHLVGARDRLDLLVRRCPAASSARAAPCRVISPSLGTAASSALV